MSGLKTALLALGGAGLAVLVVALGTIGFTDEAKPLQVAMSAGAQEPATGGDPVPDARDSYVVAELYQEYDPAPVPRSAWAHSYVDGVGVCRLQVVIATQEGYRDELPTATPRPTATHGVPPTATYQAYPWGNTFPPVAQVPPYPPDSTGAARDPNPTVGYPTPRPTNTPVVDPTDTPAPSPYPTATPQPVLADQEWKNWKDRPMSLAVTGLASLAVPRGTTVIGYVEVAVGPALSGIFDITANNTLLARSPFQDAMWSEGRAYVQLDDASTRFLMQSDAVDAHYRAARLHVEAYPIDRCDRLNLRWEESAAMLVIAMTAQPFEDWPRRRIDR